MRLAHVLRFLPYSAFRLLRKWHEGYRYEAYRQQYRISPSFQFNGMDILLYGDGQIDLGDGSYIGQGSTIQAVKGHSVRIGRRCAISHNVRIYTETNLADQDFALSRAKRFGDVVIGDDVWIGINAFIGPGITIGDNSVVGANSVVTRDIVPWSIVGGVPARLIRMKTQPQTKE